MVLSNWWESNMYSVNMLDKELIQVPGKTECGSVWFWHIIKKILHVFLIYVIFYLTFSEYATMHKKGIVLRIWISLSSLNFIIYFNELHQ